MIKKKIGRMEYLITPSKPPCGLDKFEINSVSADYDDFGRIERESDNNYGCINVHFVGSRPTNDVLQKYSIDLSEYDFIVDLLIDTIQVDRCGWCN